LIPRIAALSLGDVCPVKLNNQLFGFNTTLTSGVTVR